MREHDIRAVLSEGGTDVATTALRDMAIAGLILNGLAGYDPEDGEQAASDQFFLATEIRKEREKATRGLTAGGTDIDEAIRRAAEAGFEQPCIAEIAAGIAKHVGPVIEGLRENNRQLALDVLHEQAAVDEWKRRAEAAEAALELAEGYAANSIAELQAQLAAAREDVIREIRRGLDIAYAEWIDGHDWYAPVMAVISAAREKGGAK